MSTSTPVPASIFVLLIIFFTPSSHANANGTVCIIAQPGSLAHQQLLQLQHQALVLAAAGQQQQLNPLIAGGIPSIYRTDDPRYNILPATQPAAGGSRNFFDQPFPRGTSDQTGGKTNSFWDQPINGSVTPGQRGSGSRNRLNVNQGPDESGYQSDDASTMQQQQIPIQIDQQQIQRPQYDRSGFRREPLHPSYNPNIGKRPAVSSNEAERRTGSSPDPWSRYPVTTTTTAAPGARRRDPNLTPQSYFDPTRRPKSGNQAKDPAITTRKPFYSKNNPQAGGTAGRGTQTPGLTKEVTTTGRSKENIANNQPVDVIPGTVSPNVQTIPEYAYIKQPISKVLDQPDLELESKPVKFSILRDALDRVGLLELMSSASPVTVFAPTDEAFLQLHPDILTKMQQNPTFLRNTMLRHIVNFDMPPDTLRNNIIVPSYSGEPLIVNVVGKVSL